MRAVLLLLAASGAAQAGTVAIYRPHVIESFHCTYVDPDGTPSTGAVSATCESLDLSVDPESIFGSGFDLGAGHWSYRISLDGQTFAGGGCYILAFSSTYAVLSCAEYVP